MTTNPLHTEIRKHASQNNHQKVLSYCDRALNKDSDDYFAFYCKLVSLTKLERFDEILSIVKKSPKLNNDIYFVKAYAEYRLNKLQNALATLSKADQNDLRVRECYAQIKFKQEEFDEALTNLIIVAKNSTDDLSDERTANILACYNFTKENVHLEESYKLSECAFNMATLELNKGNYEKALELLESAEELSREALKNDECSEEEILEEIAPILVQRAFIWQKVYPERDALALKLLHDVSKSCSDNPSLQAVVSNNIVCLNKDQNIFESRRRMKSMDTVTTSALQHKLLQSQILLMGFNQALFYWKTQQIELVKSKMKTLSKNLSSSSCSGSKSIFRIKILTCLLSICVLVRDRQVNEAFKETENLIELLQNNLDETDTKTRLFAFLLAIQLKMLPVNQVHRIIDSHATPINMNIQNILAEISRFIEKYLSPDHFDSFIPIVLSLWFTSLSGEFFSQKSSDDKNKQKQKILKVLNQFMEKYSQDSRSKDILIYCADFMSRIGLFQEAANLYEKILNDGSDAKLLDENYHNSIMAKLISSLARFDSKRAEEHSATLKFDDLLTDQEIDHLETTFLFGAKYVKSLERHKNKDLSSKSPLDSENKKTHKKKRKTKLPKSYIPGTVPDPERWLPKRERTGYRQKKRNIGKNPLRGPQGQTAGSAEWDVKAMKSKVVEKAPEPVKSSKGGQNKHKKRK